MRSGIAIYIRGFCTLFIKVQQPRLCVVYMQSFRIWKNVSHTEVIQREAAASADRFAIEDAYCPHGAGLANRFAIEDAKLPARLMP